MIVIYTDPVVVNAWLGGWAGTNATGSLTTGGSVLYSHERIIGWTSPEGVKYVRRGMGHVPAVTKQHVALARSLV